MHTTIDQLARETRYLFKKHSHQLNEGLPFFSSFPENCCQGASVVFGMLVVILLKHDAVTVVKGRTRDGTDFHYWLEIDGRVYDLTIDQFEDTLGNGYEGLKAPLLGAPKHPLRMHFFHKERLSAVHAFSVFCCKHANSKDVIQAFDFVRSTLREKGWSTPPTSI